MSFRLFFVLLLPGLILTACEKQGTTDTRADYHYKGVMTVTPDTGHIALAWDISLADSTVDTVTFLLRPTLGNIVVSGKDVLDFRAGPSEQFDGLTGIEVMLAPAQEGAPRTIHMTYDGVLLPEPMPNRINSISTDRIELNVDSFWYPFDARITPDKTSDMLVRGVPGWQGVAPGRAEQTEQGLRIINGRPSNDIAFTLARRFKVTEGAGFAIHDTRSEPEGVEALGHAAAYCIDFLNDAAGRNPSLPPVRLVVNDREGSGYSRGNYIALTDVSDSEPERLLQFICHELAHFWSSRGKFDTVDNWLNESFADYLANMALRDRFGEQAFAARMARYAEQIEGEDLPPVWVPGATARGPYLVNYRKGPLALMRLEEYLGRDVFAEFIYRYLSENIGTTPVLLNMLEDVAGADARKEFTAVLAEEG